MIEFLNLEKVDQIVELQLNNNFTDGWNKTMLENAFKGGNYVCFGVYENKKLIAFLGLSVSIDTCDIEDVLVDINNRRKGLAENLIDYALNYSKTQNKEKVFLEVRESNLSARALYQKKGFNQISVRKNYYSDGENAVVYLREI